MQTKSYVAFLILFLILASAAPVVAQDTAQTKEVLVPEITKVTLDSIPRNWSSLSLLYPTIYHPPNRVVDEVEHFEQSVPQLVDTEVLGYSYEGRPIVSMRITNELATRPKAKTLVVANHHGREQITVELALRFALWLLNGYGNNPNITHYIDTEEIFIIPMLNPDALQRVVVNYDNWLRKNLRPWDEDRDGIADEDPPDDAN
ncbi:MAG: M14 family zinc carboxypeptidase, partial [Candidatus Hodarchaeota archaeon]